MVTRHLPLRSFVALAAIAVSLSFAYIPDSRASDDALSSAKSLQSVFADVADKAFPCVVIVKVKKAGAGPDYASGSNIPLPPWIQPPQRGETEEVGALGSGFIIREDGYIITNHHVAGDALEMAVTLHDGRVFPAKLVGTDWKTDISVLKIDAKGKLPFLKFADQEKVRIGHFAIAIGAPFSLGYTMTTGIVSQKGRAVGLNLYEDYIQTDAAINPGNSGGPLLNLDGEVIGVNDFILSGSGAQGAPAGNTGLAFAIPGNLAQSVAESLILHGEVVRPWIGVAMQALDEPLKRQFKVESGVLVKSLVTGDPADKAGLEPGDVIIRLGQTPVKTPHDIQFGLLKYKPGEKIPMSVLRGGKEMEVDVVAGRQRSDTMSGETPGAATLSDAQGGGALAGFGLKLSNRNGQVIINEVLPGSSAELAGLVPGMRVSAVNRHRVESAQDAERAAASNQHRVLLYVDDGSAGCFVALSK